jgi:hypothetical protein
VDFAIVGHEREREKEEGGRTTEKISTLAPSHFVEIGDQVVVVVDHLSRLLLAQFGLQDKEEINRSNKGAMVQLAKAKAENTDLLLVALLDVEEVFIV